MVDATREEEKRFEAFLQMIDLSVSGAKGEKIYTSDTIDWSKVIRYGRYAENARQDAGIIAHTPIYSKALRKSPAEFFAAIKSGRRFTSQHAVVFLSNVIHHSAAMNEDEIAVTLRTRMLGKSLVCQRTAPPCNARFSCVSSRFLRFRWWAKERKKPQLPTVLLDKC